MTQTVARGNRDTAKTASGRRLRVDIQALRAIAIAAVVLNHLWPTRLTGGFVGVDVFFVISGFLITAHLFGELERTGTVRLRAFYARRIARLLPAALAVLVVTLAAVWLFLPEGRWELNARQIAASALYVENWSLAANAVDYFAHDAAPSAVQHYWSLSVEEQFYIVWPLILLLATTWLWRGKGDLRRRAGGALSVVAALSFALSIWFTAVAPTAAYFATFTRAWEFAVGGLVFLVLGDRRLPPALAGALVVLGLGAIAGSALTFTGGMAFPGWVAAIPVLGTAAVIVAGNADGAPRWWNALAGLRPIQWVGDVSYSWYLWHWPVIVVLPFVMAQTLTGWHRIGILVGTLILADLTRRWVEKPGIRIIGRRARVRETFLVTAAAMAVIVALCIAVAIAGHAKVEAQSPEGALPTGSCVGPQALADPATCEVSAPVIDPETSADDEYFFTPPECGDFLPGLTYGDKRTTHECRFASGEPRKQVWLVGDSHAQQWQGAVFDLARENDWDVKISFMGGCTVADVDFTGFRGEWGEADRDACRQFSHDVAAEIAQEKPDIVFTSMAARQQLADDGSGRPVGAQQVEGLRSYWEEWAAAGSTVVAIADTPLNGQVRSPDCVLVSSRTPQTCAVPRTTALPPDPIVEAGLAGGPGIHLLDLTDRMCDASTCYAAVGGVGVFYDADHLSLEFVRMLAPEWTTRLTASGVGL